MTTLGGTAGPQPPDLTVVSATGDAPKEAPVSLVLLSVELTALSGSSSPPSRREGLYIYLHVYMYYIYIYKVHR